MKSHSIQTTKTARYYTLGELNESTKEIVIVFHGYAQLAKEFIQNFKSIHTKNRFIIAPEGLNKFYSKGFYGNVAASWMTKEDRENEIKDYLTLLDNIFKQLSDKINAETKIKLFGFSQGCATATRWYIHSDLPNTELILWGNSIPPDIDFQILKSRLVEPITIVIGDEDEFISSEILDDEIAQLKEKNVPFELKKYPGKHNVQPGLLKELNLFK